MVKAFVQGVVVSAIVSIYYQHRLSQYTEIMNKQLERNIDSLKSQELVFNEEREKLQAEIDKLRLENSKKNSWF